eukprot:4517976-Amphidinium_carterae.1
MDQGQELEFTMLPHAELLDLRRNYALILGDAPLEKEDVTDAQLIVLKRWPVGWILDWFLRWTLASG